MGAYFKVGTASGQSLTFGLGLYDSSGTWIGWSYTPSLSLNTTGKWQYVEGQITLPSGASFALDSPKVTLSGMSADEKVRMDEMVLKPYRGATAIGAHGDQCSTCTYHASDWFNANSTIGPLQADKEFFQWRLLEIR